jgi:hypothetical protein
MLKKFNGQERKFTDFIAFKNIIEDDMKDNVDDPSTAAEFADRAWQKYGQRFLNICIEHKMNHGSMSVG